MTTEAKVGVFVIASLLVLGSATYFVHTTQTVRGQVPYNDSPALCRRSRPLERPCSSAASRWAR